MLGTFVWGVIAGVAMIQSGMSVGQAIGMSIAGLKPICEIQFDGWTVNLPRRELLSPTGAVVDLTGAEFGAIVELSEHAAGMPGCRPIERRQWPDICEARMAMTS